MALAPKKGFIGEIYELFNARRTSPFEASTTVMVAGGSPLPRQSGAVEKPILELEEDHEAARLCAPRQRPF